MADRLPVSRETRTTEKTDRLPAWNPDAVQLNKLSGSDYRDILTKMIGDAYTTGKGALTSEPDWGDIGNAVYGLPRRITEGAISAPGDLRDLGWMARDLVAMKMGIDPRNVALMDKIMGILPSTQLMRQLPTGEEVESFTNDYLGEKYEPTSPAGKAISGIGEAVVDPTIALPGGAALKGARMAARAVKGALR